MSSIASLFQAVQAPILTPTGRESFDPRNVPNQLVVLSGPAFLHILSSLLEGLHSLFYGSPPWRVWMCGMRCLHRLGYSQGVACVALCRDQRRTRWKRRGLSSTKIRHELVSDPYPLNGSGNIIIFTIKVFLRISENLARK